MKAGTHNHVKTKRLKRLLGVPLYRVVGLLEGIWLLCTDCCDEGNIGKFTDQEISDYLEWDGNPTELVSALVESGWIDPCGDARLVVHDWIEIRKQYRQERSPRDHLDPSVARHNVSVHVRMSKKFGLESSLTVDEWFRRIWEFENKCAYCRNDGIPLQIEHMIPSSKGGGTCLENVVPACESCNKSKGDGFPLDLFAKEAS